MPTPDDTIDLAEFEGNALSLDDFEATKTPGTVPSEGGDAGGLRSFVERVGLGGTYGLGEKLTQPGNPIRELLDRVGASNLPVWGAGGGRTLDELRSSQQEFAKQSPFLSRVAEGVGQAVTAAPLAAAGAPATLAGKVGAGALAGTVGGAGSSVGDAGREERDIDPADVVASSLAGGVAGGGTALVGAGLGALGRKVFGDTAEAAARARLVQAGLTNKQIENITDFYPGGTQAAAERLLETGSIKGLFGGRVGFTGASDADALLKPASKVFQETAEAGKPIRISPFDVRQQIQDTAQFYKNTPEETAQRTFAAIKNKMDLLRQSGDIDFNTAMNIRDMTRKASDAAMRTGNVPENLASRELRLGVTSALDDALGKLGVDIPGLKQARTDWRLGTALEEAATRNARAGAGLAPGLSSTVAASGRGGLVAGAVMEGLRQAGPSLKATGLSALPKFQPGGAGRAIATSRPAVDLSLAATRAVRDRNEATGSATPTGLSEAVQATLNNNPEVLGKFAAPLQEAAQRGPAALKVQLFVLQQYDPEARKMLRDMQNAKSKADEAWLENLDSMYGNEGQEGE